MQKRPVVLPRRLKKRAVAIAINGGIRLPVLAKKLRIPLNTVRRWKHRFRGQIKRRRLGPKKLQKHVKLLQALTQRARVQSRIVRLKAALQGG